MTVKLKLLTRLTRLGLIQAVQYILMQVQNRGIYHHAFKI